MANSYATEPSLLPTSMPPTKELEAMKGDVVVRPSRCIRRLARDPIKQRRCEIFIYLLGAMSILFLLSRYLPTGWTSQLFKKHTHQPQIIQLTKLSPSLRPTPHNDRRLVVVGDVHGCKDELEHLLEHIDFNKHTDHLILAGDMIDKGPSSHGVIKLARHLGASCVRGNHEDNILSARAELDRGIEVEEGALSKRVIKRRNVASELSDKDIEWLQHCPLILELGPLPSLPHASSAVVVHAGLVPGIPLLDQDPFAVMHMRSISKKHKHMSPEEGRDDGEPWWRVWNHEQDVLYKSGVKEAMMVVYGHDSRTGLNERKWSLGLDSGCVGGGRLSAVVIDNKHAKVHSVKCRDER